MPIPFELDIVRLRKVDFHVEMFISDKECKVAVVRGGMGNHPGVLGQVVYSTIKYPLDKSHEAKDEARRWIERNNVGRVHFSFGG